jgi:4-hydroxy-tetrahydrodipicolinate reductase
VSWSLTSYDAVCRVIKIAVSGAAGRMGSLLCRTIADASDDLQLVVAHDPGALGEERCGLPVTNDVDLLGTADVVVEFTTPSVVMDNLAHWRRLDLHAVVGTSGFYADRIRQLSAMWGAGPMRCLVVPNFSIGAVTMMRLAEIAAPHFAAAEVIELHHEGKLDAPSGTAIATAERIGAAAKDRDAPATRTASSARGADISGVAVHSVRLPGLVAHQEVLLGNPGEWLTIRHDTSDRAAFMPGVLLAVRRVADLPDPVTIGLEGLLGLD